MTKHVSICRDFNIARRFATCAIVVVACVSWGTVSARASMISSCESISVDRDLASLDKAWTSVDPFFDLGFAVLGSWGDLASSSSVPEQPAVPTSPSKRLASELPMLDVEIPMSSGADGAGAACSPSGGGGTSLAPGAIFCWVLELPPPTLVSWLQARGVQDIPPAPPFELLRPPQILTNLA